ncbi:MAG: hypothetical protein IKB15_02465 [Alistipes sp.]|nr:hypothetical protein [Alistipes sp.]
MKKFFSMMMACAAVFALTACGEDGPEGNNPGGGTGGGNKGGQLATPEVTETHTETSFTLTWGAVENAEAYMLNLDGKFYNTEECSYTFENLNAGNYTVRVKATAEGYEESEWAKITVTLTGLTEVDWFTQTLSLPDVDETVDYGNGQVVVYQPYNAVKVLWKGTGVADIQYALFETENIAGATDAQIKAQLGSFPADQVTGALEVINSEEGLEVIYGGCTGSTNYTAYVLVKNEAGLEFFTKSEITTAEAVVSDATKAWLGTYTAYTEKIVDLTAKTNPIKDQKTDFTFTVSVVPGTANEVMVDGISIIGTGTPAYGQVVEKEGVKYLTLINQVAIADIGEGFYATWLPYCVLESGEATFVTGQFGAIYLAMDADGNITYTPGNGTIDAGDFTVAAFDVIAYGEGGLGVLSDGNGNEFKDWKYGDWKDVKKSETAAARVMNAPAKKLSVAYELPASMLY